MASAMRKMAVYLGLVEDEDRYDEYDEYDDYDRDDRREARSDDREGHESRESRDPRESRTERDDRTRTITAVRDEPRSGAAVTPMPDRRPVASPDRRGATVMTPQPAGSLDRITTIHPRAYNDAKSIGESFRSGTPVIMNLTDMDDSDAKRLVDFAAGLIFGLRGTLERVTNKVFLLSPANVSVTAEDKARMAESGFFNQS